AFAQLLELVGKDVADDAVAGGARLVVGEAISLRFLSAGSRCDKQCAQGRCRREKPQNHAVLPCCGTAPAPAAFARWGHWISREKAPASPRPLLLEHDIGIVLRRRPSGKNLRLGRRACQHGAPTAARNGAPIRRGAEHWLRVTVFLPGEKGRTR